MPIDRFGEPWPETSPRGYADPRDRRYDDPRDRSFGPDPRDRGFDPRDHAYGPRDPRYDERDRGYDRDYARAAPPPPRRRSLLSGRNLALGAGAAIIAGLVLGLWAKPDFGRDPTAGAAHTATPVPIEVGKPRSLPTVRPAGKLEVLPPDQARSMASSSYIPGPPPPLPASSADRGAPAPAQARPRAEQGYAPAPMAPQRAPAPAPAVRSAPPPVLAQPRMAETFGRPGFDCGGARSAAEAMVCGDPELASADRELAQAYRRAMRSGAAPRSAIRADQRDWLAIREDAARHSRRAVANIYRQRIEELNAMAQAGPGEDDGPG